MLEAGPPLDASTRPEIQQEWPATFGNSDIWAWSGADPSCAFVDRFGRERAPQAPLSRPPACGPRGGLVPAGVRT